MRPTAPHSTCTEVVWRHYGHMRASLPLLLLLPVAAEAAAVSPPPASSTVRIYRCVGSNGAVSLQDAPCSKGRQQVLNMQRPQDPSARVVSTSPTVDATPAAPSGQAAREIRTVRLQPPQPMYECVSDEGNRYTSDSAEGNPRWVPIWTYGLVGAHHPQRSPIPPALGPHPVPGGGAHYRPGVIVPSGSVLVRDSCHVLPPQEVCARLKDRRWELIRRYNSALQSEREQLVREQRGIDARLDQDCGGA